MDYTLFGIPADIQVYLREARRQAWPFLPEPFQSLEIGVGLPGNLPESLASENPRYPGKSNYHVLKLCAEKAVKEELHEDVIAIVFVVDRYAYQLHHNETEILLDMVQKVVDKCRGVSIPPQLISRRIRLLKDLGHYRAADKAVTDALVQSARALQTGDLRLGSWRFKNRTNFLLAAANWLNLKGLIQYSLGNPVDAAVYLVANGQMAVELNEPMGKGFCFQLLTDVLVDASPSDREMFLSAIDVQNMNCTSAILLAEQFCKNAASLMKPVQFYYMKQMRKLAYIHLVLATKSEEKRYMPALLLGCLLECLPRDTSNLDFKSQEILIDFAFTYFLVYSALEYFGRKNTDILQEAMDLFHTVCKDEKNVDETYLKNHVLKTRNYLKMVQNLVGEEIVDIETEIELPILKDSFTPYDIIHAFHNKNVHVGVNPLAKTEEDPIPIVDPLATTVFKSIPRSKQSESFEHSFSGEKQCSESARATVADGSVYQSLLSDPVCELQGLDSPLRLLSIVESEQVQQAQGATSGEDSTVFGNTQILKTCLTQDTVYRANVWKFHPQDNDWTVQKTLAYVHDQLNVQKSSLRDVIKLQYLHQDEYKGMYVGKIYRTKMSHGTYVDDVIMHQRSRHFVRLFNRRLQYSKFVNSMIMVPVLHMQIVRANDDVITEVLNVEPFINGKFTKITSNAGTVNETVEMRLMDLALAFSHFTWCESKGKRMVTDLQGWISDDPNVPFILTDPALHSVCREDPKLTNLGLEGFEAFWRKQHPNCNQVCKLLGLTRGN